MHLTSSKKSLLIVRNLLTKIKDFRMIPEKEQ